MEIPTFTEKKVPVNFMEDYINNETTQEGTKFKIILSCINEFEILPSLTEMASILEYEAKALSYAFELAISILHTHDFEKDYTEIYNAVNEVEPYSTYKNDGIALSKYLILEGVLEELNIIKMIKEAVSEINFNYNLVDREIIQLLECIKTNQ